MRHIPPITLNWNKLHVSCPIQTNHTNYSFSLSGKSGFIYSIDFLLKCPEKPDERVIGAARERKSCVTWGCCLAAGGFTKHPQLPRIYSKAYCSLL